MIVRQGLIESYSYGDKLWNRKVLDLVELKTEYTRCGFNTTRHEERVSLDGHVVPQKYTFRYVGSMLHKDGDIDACEPSSQS